MSDKFILYAPGRKDNDNLGVVRLPQNCYEKVLELKKRTGLPLGRILEQCVDYALEHMEGGADGNP